MRNTISSSKNFGNSNFVANTAYRNCTSQPLNSLVVNQERNQSINWDKICSSSQPILLRRVSTRTDLVKNSKANTALQLAVNSSFVHLVRDTSLLAKTVCVHIVFAIKTRIRLVRPLIDAKYAVVSVIQHCMTQQNESNVQQQLFQQKTHKPVSQLFRQKTRQRLKIRSTILRQKASRIRIQTALRATLQRS